MATSTVPSSTASTAASTVPASPSHAIIVSRSGSSSSVILTDRGSSPPVGFLAGSALMTALGVGWNWLIVLVAVAVSVVFAVFALVTNFPRIVLVIVSATAGATAMVAGGMLLVGALETADLTRAYVTERIEDDWWWYLGYLALVLAGIFSQAAGNARDDARLAWQIQQARGPA